MSSPAAGISMLEKKAHKKSLAADFESSDADEIDKGADTVMDLDFSNDDNQIPIILNFPILSHLPCFFHHFPHYMVCRHVLIVTFRATYTSSSIGKSSFKEIQYCLLLSRKSVFVFSRT